MKGKTSAGLNASQNNSSSTSSIDLGIFIKSVIHGGAASRYSIIIVLLFNTFLINCIQFLVNLRS